MRPSLVASASIFFFLTMLVPSGLCGQVSDSPGSVNCPSAVNLALTITTEGGAVIPHAFVILREDTLGQPRGVRVFELELRTDETGKASAAVPCNYLDVFVAHEGFAPAAQKILITTDAHTFSVALKSYPITRTTEVVVSGIVPTVSADLPASIDDPGQPLRRRIPKADPKKYEGIRDGQDWQNPKMFVRAEGIEVIGVTPPARGVPAESVPDILEHLPESAWPYGLVVAVSDVGVIGSRKDIPRIQVNRTKLLKMLRQHGIAVKLWPSLSCRKIPITLNSVSVASSLLEALPRRH